MFLKVHAFGSLVVRAVLGKKPSETIKSDSKTRKVKTSVNSRISRLRRETGRGQQLGPKKRLWKVSSKRCGPTIRITSSIGCLTRLQSVSGWLSKSGNGFKGWPILTPTGETCSARSGESYLPKFC